MPHQCIRCGAQYTEGSETLLIGCKCGGRFFFFYKEKNTSPELIEQIAELEPEQRKEIEKKIEQEVKQTIGPQKTKDNKPVILDLESIRITEEGKYEIDLMSLFRRKPIVYRLSEGKYFIDLPGTFKLIKLRDRKPKKKKVPTEKSENEKNTGKQN